MPFKTDSQAHAPVGVKKYKVIEQMSTGKESCTFIQWLINILMSA
jgi:hypothetical protein